jgi:anaerobic magnesium-protoporphyrin IX monomethyl ester cyclase
MKIVLATTPRTGEPWNSGSFPPLGLLYVAGGLRSLPEIETKVLDTYGEWLNVDQSIERMLALSPDVVGLTITSGNVEEGRLLITKLKAVLPEVVIVAGGIHPTLFDRLLLRQIPELDFCLRGEGDVSFGVLCKRILEGEDVAGVPGLSYRSNGEVIRGVPQVIDDLDSIPFPDRSLLDYDGYGSQWYGFKLPDLPPTTTAFSSRGCPYHCTFCADTKICGGRFRARSAENVLEELLMLSDQGYKFVIFFDDNLVFDVPRLNKLCHLILEHKLDMRLACAGTVHMLPQSTLDLMHKAGFDLLFIGVESGSDAQLKRFGKPANRSGLAAGIQRARKANIFTLASFVNGAPGETDSDFQATLDFIKEVRPHLAETNSLMVYPGSQLWEDLNGPDEPETLEASFGRSIWRFPGQVAKETVMAREMAFRKTFARNVYDWRSIPEFFRIVFNNLSMRNALKSALKNPKLLLPYVTGKPPR